MSFSTALLLNDVDDYIAPSQICIKPVKIDTIAGKTKSIIIGENGSYTAVTEDGKSYGLKQASITLNDCLACSGCITTAESVLVAEHSFEVLLNQLSNREDDSKCSTKICVVSVCSQSIASLLAEALSSSESQLAQQFDNWSQKQNEQLKTMDSMRKFVADYFYSIGVHLVLDITWARDLALQESGLEFVERFKNQEQQLPVFCGICPGWVCYAEKTHGSNRTPTNGSSSNFSIVPYISKVRSPQQIAGALLKKQTNPGQIYHVTLMPCFDKKLEASRPEFSVPSESSDSRNPDVDLVLATNEFVQLVEAQHNSNSGSGQLDEGLTNVLNSLLTHFSMAYIKPTTAHRPIDPALSRTIELGQLSSYRHGGTGSGGYANFCFRWAASNLFDIPISSDLSIDDHVLIRQLHNRDIEEMLLFQTKDDRDRAVEFLKSLTTTTSRVPYRHLNGTGPPALLSFAVANGFRNIQTIVQYLRKYNMKKNGIFTKPKISDSKRLSAQYPFDYVEVMACPGGCLNGGGQLKGHHDKTRETYFSQPLVEPMSNQTIQKLYNSIDSTDRNHECLRTTYREVPKIEIINPSALHW